MEKDYERKRRRRSEEDKARLDELEPGGSEYSLELRKQHKREKAAEKKRRQRARRRMASTLHSPPPFPIYAASSSSTLNPYTDPLGTNLFNLTMSSTASSSSVSPLSMSTTATTTPSSSTPRLMVDTFRGLQVTPSTSSSSSSSLGSALASVWSASVSTSASASSDSTSSTTTTTTTTTRGNRNASASYSTITTTAAAANAQNKGERGKSKSKKRNRESAKMKTLKELLDNVANRKLRDYGKSSQTFYRKVVEEGVLQLLQAKLPLDNEDVHRELLAEIFGSYTPDPEAKKRKTSEKLFESLGELYCDQRHQDQFIQLASIPVSQGFSNRQLSEAMGRGEGTKISDALYAKVKSHVQADRAGMEAKFRAPFHRSRTNKINNMLKFVEYLVEASVASAEQRKVDVGAETKCIPLIQRTMSKQSIIDSFKRKFPSHGMANKDFNHIIKFLAPSRDKILGALDTCTEINGRQNFVTMRLLLKKFAGVIEGDEALSHMCQEAEQLLNFNEVFLKSGNGLKAAEHLGGCLDQCHECDEANHCMFYLLGKRDPDAVEEEGALSCGHKHSGSCLECNGLLDLVGKIAEITDYIDEKKFQTLQRREGSVYDWPAYIGLGERRPPEINKLWVAMGACVSRYLHYFGHRVRLINEDNWEPWVIAQLKEDPTMFAIECDWAMKYLSVKYREMQSDFFGKRGILWFGARVMWYDQREGRLKHYFTNQISPDSVEDSYSSVEQVTATLKFHRDNYSGLRHEKFHLRTDGAGYFTSADFTGRLPYTHLEIGYKCLSHHKGECGGGKCSVDANFGCSKAAVDDLILTSKGRWDVLTANDLVMNLQQCHKLGRVPNTFSFLVTPNPGHEILKSNMNDVEKAKCRFGSCAMRKFHYDGDVSKWQIKLYSSSFLDRDRDIPDQLDHATMVQNLWESHSSDQVLPVGNVQYPESLSEDQLLTRVKVKEEETDKYRAKVTKRLNAERRQAKRAELMTEEAEDGVHRKFKCSNPGCIRQFANRGTLRWHEMRTPTYCSDGGSIFRASKEEHRSEPGRFSGLEGKALWAEMLNEIKFSPHYKSLGIAAATCTRSDEKPAAKFGQAVLSTRVKTSFPRDIIDAIKAMTEATGDDAKRRAIRHNDMYDYLRQMGLDVMAQRFPDIPAFASNNNTKKYEEFEVPHPDRIKQISNNYLQQLKKKRRLRGSVPLERSLRGKVMAYLLTRRGQFDENEAVLIADELTHRGVGDAIHTETLIQANLLGLPISCENDWPRETRKKIVHSIRGDLRAHINKIPPDFLADYLFVQPENARREHELYGSDDDDDRPGWVWADDEDGNDDESDDDDDVDERGISSREKREYAKHVPVSAMERSNPLRHNKIKALQSYVGKTFTEVEDTAGRAKKRKTKKYVISDVCVYPNDEETFFFEYYDAYKYSEKPTSLKGREYTTVVEFGKDGLIFDEDEERGAE